MDAERIRTLNMYLMGIDSLIAMICNKTVYGTCVTTPIVPEIEGIRALTDKCRVELMRLRNPEIVGTHWAGENNGE